MLRRDILKGIASAGIGFGVLPISSALASTTASTSTTSSAALERGHKRLILVELSGANDGLNTLVQWKSDFYHALRPTLSLIEREVTTLHGDMAMHNALDPLMKHWDNNDLAWVQGLGYPSPNRSHFKSIALWESAGDGISDVQSNGWMTHAMEHGLQRQVISAHGVSVGGDMNLFNSDSGRWLSVDSAAQLTNMRSPTVPNNNGLAYESGTAKLDNIQFVSTQLELLDRMLSDISDRLDGVPAMRGFPNNKFAQQLQTVAQLISSGIDTPVYRVRLDGFDTHQGQLQRHGRLLKQLGKGLDVMARSLKRMGEWDNTLIMTYSEFGRRAAENNSGGTDHGTAAPHLLLGGGVRGGLFGDAPDLSQLHDGDPDYTLDYRGLYEHVLNAWFDVKPDANDLRQYADQRLVKLFS